MQQDVHPCLVPLCFREPHWRPPNVLAGPVASSPRPGALFTSFRLLSPFKKLRDHTQARTYQPSRCYWWIGGMYRFPGQTASPSKHNRSRCSKQHPDISDCKFRRHLPSPPHAVACCAVDPVARHPQALTLCLERKRLLAQTARPCCRSKACCTG